MHAAFMNGACRWTVPNVAVGAALAGWFAGIDAGPTLVGFAIAFSILGVVPILASGALLGGTLGAAVRWGEVPRGPALVVGAAYGAAMAGLQALAAVQVLGLEAAPAAASLVEMAAAAGIVYGTLAAAGALEGLPATETADDATWRPAPARASTPVIVRRRVRAQGEATDLCGLAAARPLTGRI